MSVCVCVCMKDLVSLVFPYCLYKPRPNLECSGSAEIFPMIGREGLGTSFWGSLPLYFLMTHLLFQECYGSIIFESEKLCIKEIKTNRDTWRNAFRLPLELT